MKLFSPAKINLFLEVTGKRQDGYHLLHSLMCCVSLFDVITLNPDASEFSITCNQPDIPADDSNLAMKAAKMFCREYQHCSGVSIDLEKSIPAGAGLGGGSSNAATVLTALNAWFGAPFSGSELIEMGVALGADVPFFVYNKPAIAEGIGERLEFCENLKPYTVIIIHPGDFVSTGEVYKKLNFGLTKREKKIKSRLLNKGLLDPVEYLFNDLETPAISICSNIKAVKEVLTEQSADGVLMSGSGSAVFGLFSDCGRAKKAFDNLKTIMKSNKHCTGWQGFVADMIL